MTDTVVFIQVNRSHPVHLLNMIKYDKCKYLKSNIHNDYIVI